MLRVGDQIVEAIETHTALRGAAARAKALEWLGRVGIPEPERRIDDYPFRMSGGQKQRVMIAMTLAAEPDFLLADEPTTALDVTIQAQILDLLRGLQRSEGMGLLLITHDLAVVSGMADRVALMYAGEIVEVAPAARFFAAPGHPYAQALLRALPGAARRGQPLEAIPGTVPALTQDFVGCRFAPRCARAMPACSVDAVPLFELGAGHAVRCLLHAPAGATNASVTPGRAATDEPVAAAVPAPPALAADAVAPGSASATAAIEAQRQPTGRLSALAADPVPGPSAHEMGAAPLLEIQDLRVRFVSRRGWLQRPQGGFEAVAGVSLKLARGRTLALVGESGCGKTTIGKAIVQLLRGQAELSGRVLLDGDDLCTLHGAELLAARRRVQIIFQDPFASLNPRMRVFDLLEEGLIALQPQLEPEARRARIETLTEQVGLRRDALQRWPHEFSGGQRQRIAIARALAVHPDLIVCDEPTSALDVSVQAQILNLLRELQTDLGLAYLFITHKIGVVEAIADDVAVMRAGRIVEQGPRDAVLDRPQQAYTVELLAAVPRLTVLA